MVRGVDAADEGQGVGDVAVAQALNKPTDTKTVGQKVRLLNRMAWFLCSSKEFSLADVYRLQLQDWLRASHQYAQAHNHRVNARRAGDR
jgi:hypothetical protein